MISLSHDLVQTSFLNSELVFNDLVTRCDTVTSSVTERYNLFRGLGIAVIHYAPSSKEVFRKGLIYIVETGRGLRRIRRPLERRGWTCWHS